MSAPISKTQRQSLRPKYEAAIAHGSCVEPLRKACEIYGETPSREPLRYEAHAVQDMAAQTNIELG